MIFDKISLLAINQLLGTGLIGVPTVSHDLALIFNDSKNLGFVNSDHIKKSSVGEFYEKNMAEFLTLAKDVYDYTMTKSGSSYVAFKTAMQVTPLGVLVDTSVDDCAFFTKKDMFSLWAYPLPEIRTIWAAARIWSGVEEDKAMNRYLKRTMVIERAAQGVCVGYIPNISVPVIESIKSDASFRREYLVADLLYPWVTQPLKQIRMLVPSLDPATNSMILNEGVPEDKEAVVMPCADGPHALTYDCVTDFLSYFCVRMNMSKNYTMSTQAQFWTPFFGISDYETLKNTIKDPALLDRIDKAFLASKRLYVEILKTGLKYDAQYAVLGGMAGRYTISGSTAGMLSLVNSSKNHWSTGLSNTIINYISDSLDVDWWGDSKLPSSSDTEEVITEHF